MQAHKASDVACAVQFGLSPSVKNGLWLDARNAAVGDAKGTAQLYAKARPPAVSLTS